LNKVLGLSLLKKISLATGSGGREMAAFLNEYIKKYFSNNILDSMRDAAYLDISGELAFTTDSFVVRPEFFPGGDIGKLAVCGTVNDLAVSGAEPLYLSFGLIMPDGYDVENLERVFKSMSEMAEEAGVKIVCGDTKVVEKDAVDGLLINTSGVGQIKRRTGDFENIFAGDHIIITSDMARHGMSVMLARGDLGFDGDIETDCAVLSNMLMDLLDTDYVKFARDATRGGVAAVLNEISEMTGLGMLVDESSLVIQENVAGLCDILGFEPLAVANEGLAVIIVQAGKADAVLDILKKHECGRNAYQAGEVTDDGKVLLQTSIGGKRIIEMPGGELLPRIC